MKLKIFLFLIVLCSGCYKYNSMYSINYQGITNVEELKAECKASFDLAEKEIFKPIVPKPDDGTNPDPAKCICNGTGIIVQGDGHKTLCPFHGKSSNKR